MKIRTEISKLLDKESQIRNKIKDIQNYRCEHVNSLYEAQGSSGNWDDPEGYYWYQFYCYDCRKRWSTEQKLGLTGNSVRVDKIDYDKNPRIVELEIQIARVK